MTSADVMEQITQMNQRIHDFENYDVPSYLRSEGIAVTADGYLAEARYAVRTAELAYVLRNRVIYPEARNLLDDLRAQGFDVKMDMQSYKLKYFGQL